MARRIRELSTAELAVLVRSGTELDTGQVLEVLRNPFCTAELAQTVAAVPSWLRSHSVREVLASFRGLPFGHALDLLGTLPWVSLLRVAQEPAAPPVVKRHAERKLLERLPKLTLGEKVALARRAHRPVLRSLIAAADPQVLVALLENGRLVENDVLLMINRGCGGRPEVFREIARHRRWGSCREVRGALVAAPGVPLPVALAALVQLSTEELRRLLRRPDLSEPIRSAAWEVIAKRRREAVCG